MATREIPNETFKEAPLLDHLEELRLRIIWSAVAWIAGGAITFANLNLAIELLKRPLLVYSQNKGLDVEIISLRITEQLSASFLVAAVGGLFLAMPMLIYQLWAFVSPGLTRRERGYAFPFIFGSIAAFIAGISFAYFVALPIALEFLIGFLPGVKATLPIGDYINDVITPLVMFGLLFQLPGIMFLIAKIGIVSSTFFVAQRRIAIFGIVVLAALVSPTTDPVNLAITSVPLIVLYEVGIGLAKLAERQNAVLAAKGLLEDFDET
jgi:sec-independent protein translocase protein TatC